VTLRRSPLASLKLLLIGEKNPKDLAPAELSIEFVANFPAAFSLEAV
jgi:hypothetical protein